MWSRDAPGLFGPAFHVGIERASDRKARLGGEHRLRGLGGELAAGLGGAGLHDHRPALDRPRDVERAAHREIFALVVEHVQLGGIEIDAVLDVADEGVVRPAVPQPGNHVVELARAGVALAMLHVLLEPEVQRGIRVGGGDDIPAGAAATDVVERGEPARDVVGRVEGGRAGGQEADMLGRHRQCRQQRERLERRHRVAAFQRLQRHVEHRHVVGHEEAVELAVLELLRKALQMRKVEIGVRIGARIAPGAGMDAGRPHECGQPELTRTCHGEPLARRTDALKSEPGI